MQSLRFLFVSPCVEEGFFIPVKKGMRDAAAMLGVSCEFVGTHDVDLVEQCALIRRGIVDGYDGIAVNIIDPTAFEPVLTEARDKKVPVVAFNVDGGVDRSLRMSTVSQDLYEAGRIVGQSAAEKLPAESTVLFTQHSKGITALDDRLRGIRDVLDKKKISGNVVITGVTPEAAEKVISQALRADPKIKGVLATGQVDTEGAGLAVERGFANRGYYVGGFDLSPDILRLVKSGVIHSTVDQQPYIQGFYPVLQLTQWCRYGIRPAIIDAGASVIHAADVDRVMALTQAGYR